MSQLFNPIRSPSHKASGLRPDAVRCLRLRSVAFLSFVSLAQQSCRFACGSIEQTALNGAWLAGRALAQTRAKIGLAGPKSPSFLPQRLDVAVPRRRAVLVISAAFSSVHAQGPCLRVDDQSTMDRLACASTNPGRFIQEAAA